jgi:hypothetical protein
MTTGIVPLLICRGTTHLHLDPRAEVCLIGKRQQNYAMSALPLNFRTYISIWRGEFGEGSLAGTQEF